MNPQMRRSSRFLNIVQLTLRRRVVGVHEDADGGTARHEFAQQAKPFRFQCVRQQTYPGSVSSRPAEARHEPLLDRIAPSCKDDGNSRGRRLRGQDCGLSPGGRDDAHGATDKLRRHRRKSIILAERPPVLNGHVLALDKAAFAQAAAECVHEVSGVLGRPGTEISNQRQGRLLSRHEYGARERRAG